MLILLLLTIDIEYWECVQWPKAENAGYNLVVYEE